MSSIGYVIFTALNLASVSASIAILNSNPGVKEQNMTTFNYFIFMIVILCLNLLLSIFLVMNELSS